MPRECVTEFTFARSILGTLSVSFLSQYALCVFRIHFLITFNVGALGCFKVLRGGRNFGYAVHAWWRHKCPIGLLVRTQANINLNSHRLSLGNIAVTESQPDFL